jgi:hypothetical protein
MRNAPPIVPGTPVRNSQPPMPASAAKVATLTSSAAAPTRIRAPSGSMRAKPLPSRSTTPSMPPSRTSRLEPTPITVSGTSAGSTARKSARSASSSGRNMISAGPPTPNQVMPASGADAVSRPRTGGSSSISGR